MDINDRDRCKQCLAKFTDDYLNFLLDCAQKNIENFVAAERTAEQEYNASAIEMAKLKEHIRMIEECLEKNRQSFEDDFDQIMAMEGVKKIEIEDKTILVHTKRIDQVVLGKSYDIGQKVIAIPFAYWWDKGTNRGLPRNYIRFRNGTYAGTHNHTFAKDEGAVCFGNNTESGLNKAIDDLYLDNDVVTLIHLLLSFLRLESSATPGQRREPCFGGKQYDPSTDAWDVSDDEKKEVRHKYAELFKSVALQSGKENTEEELKKLGEQHDQKRKMLFEARTKVRSALESKRAVLKKEEDMDKILERETDALLKDVRINDILYVEKYLLVDTLNNERSITIQISMSAPHLVVWRSQIRKDFPNTVSATGMPIGLSLEKTHKIALLVAEFHIAQLVDAILLHISPPKNDLEDAPYGI